MRKPNAVNRTVSVLAGLAVLVLAGATVYAADAAAPPDKPAFKPEELEQVLAPIALYPDSLLTQMLMASTYPLEVVQADRWAKQNPTVKDAALTKALESQSWDASVKSLVNFPPVLAMMSEKLDLTVKIGDAFIGQQQDVMATIQKLRAKAQETGNLKTTTEQKVVVEPQGPTQVIVIEAADPKVVYIPTYSPTVYYATWPYPAYPPAPHYPPGYVAGRAIAFGAGVAVGAAWGYAWGHSNWHGGNVDIDVHRNTNINANINRSRYQADLQVRNTSIKNGQGSFQHDAAHRQGVAYRDQKTASQFGRATSADASKAREAFRGRTDAGGIGNSGGLGNRPSTGGIGNSGGLGNRPSTGGLGNSGGLGNRPSTGGLGNSGGLGNRPSTGGLGGAASSSGRQSAFSGVNSGGAVARSDSARGSFSRSSSPSRSGGAMRSGGGRR